MIIINDTTNALPKIFGQLDQNIRCLEQALSVTTRPVSEGLAVEGSELATATAAAVIELLISVSRRDIPVTRSLVRQAVNAVTSNQAELLTDMLQDIVATTPRAKVIRPKTIGQYKYVRAIRSHTVTFGIGPAGTGKTYLAVALAVAALRQNAVERIVLTRPAIEAGEKLGFLPGDLISKVDPYLRPIYDALNEMFGIDSCAKLLERGVIEVAPLAFMRGRTLSKAFIILDEAQNTTIEQMKMFLTRFGEGSRVVVNGDVTQIDLPPGKACGLVHATEILQGIEDIAVCRLDADDIVRHDLVQRIVNAYGSGQQSTPS